MTVDLVPRWVVGEVDLTSYPFAVDADSTVDIGEPEMVVEGVASQLADGDIERIIKHGNRTYVLDVYVEGPTLGEVATSEALLRAELKRTGLLLTHDPGDGLCPSSVYEVQTAQLTPQRRDDHESHLIRKFTLTLTCAPFARSAEPVTVDAMLSGTTTVTVDTCDVATGWTGTRNGAPESATTFWEAGSVAVAELSSVVGFPPEAWTLTRTGTIDLTATPYLVVELTTLSAKSGAPLDIECYAGTSSSDPRLPLLSVRKLTDGSGHFRVVFDGTAAGSISAVTFTHTSAAGYGHKWQGILVRNVARSDVAPNITARQVTRVLAVGGTERTPASIQISDPDGTADLGLTILHTSPEDGSGYAPPLRRWRTNGNTVTTDTSLVSGAWEPLHPDAVGFEVPTSSLPEGPYLLCARLRASVAGTHRIFFTGFTRLPPPNDSVLSGDDDRAEWVSFPVANQWIYVDLGVLTLPTVRTSAGMSVVALQRDFGSAANIDVDEAWLFRIGEDCALTVEDDIMSPNLWADSPGQGYPVPTLWMGDEMSTRSNPGSAPRSRGNHVLRAEGTAVFVATSGVENPSVSGTFYRRWHSNAAD